MRKLASGILVVVVLFVLLVAGSLFARSRTAPVESAAPATNADLQIKEVDLEETTRGIRWRLKADQALMYEQEGRTILRNPAVQVYERERAWRIVGKEGELDRKTQNVELRHNVVLESSDGIRLETTVLRWDAVDRRLWTDAPVTLTRDGSVVRGAGLEVRMEDESTTVAGRVHARFAAPPPR